MKNILINGIKLFFSHDKNNHSQLIRNDLLLTKMLLLNPYNFDSLLRIWSLGEIDSSSENDLSLEGRVKRLPAKFEDYSDKKYSERKTEDLLSLIESVNSFFNKAENESEILELKLKLEDLFFSLVAVSEFYLENLDLLKKIILRKFEKLSVNELVYIFSLDAIERLNLWRKRIEYLKSAIVNQELSKFVIVLSNLHDVVLDIISSDFIKIKELQIKYLRSFHIEIPSLTTLRKEFYLFEESLNKVSFLHLNRIKLSTERYNVSRRKSLRKKLIWYYDDIIKISDKSDIIIAFSTFLLHLESIDSDLKHPSESFLMEFLGRIEEDVEKEIYFEISNYPLLINQ